MTRGTGVVAKGDDHERENTGGSYRVADRRKTICVLTRDFIGKGTLRGAQEIKPARRNRFQTRGIGIQKDQTSDRKHLASRVLAQACHGGNQSPAKASMDKKTSDVSNGGVPDDETDSRKSQGEPRHVLVTGRSTLSSQDVYQEKFKESLQGS